MKSILFAVLLSTGLVVSAAAQDKVNEKDVPVVVKTSFKSEFSHAQEVEWILKEGKYKASFKVNGLEHTAAYGTDGKLAARGMKIRSSELPSAVADAVKSAYAGKNINEVYRIDTNGAVQYLIKFEGEPETKVLYSANGQLVK